MSPAVGCGLGAGVAGVAGLGVADVEGVGLAEGVGFDAVVVGTVVGVAGTVVPDGDGASVVGSACDGEEDAAGDVGDGAATGSLGELPDPPKDTAPHPPRAVAATMRAAASTVVERVE